MLIFFLQENPRWEMVDVKYVRPLKRYIPLDELKKIHLEHKASGGPLSRLALFTRARLSVQPITEEEWDYILAMENDGKSK
jgi:predicted RNA-binding protein with PUA-like domain